MRLPSRPLTSLLAAALLLASPLSAQRAHLPGEPEHHTLYDARLDVDLVRPEVRSAIVRSRTPAARVARDADLARLRAEIPELRLDEDEFFGTPHFLRSTRQLLTAPAPGVRPVDVVARFVDDNRGLFEVDGHEVMRSRMARDFVTRHNGITHLTFQQQLGALDIVGAEMKANVAADGRLVTIGSTLLPRPEGDFVLPRLGLGPEAAVRLAAGHVGITTTQALLPDGPSRGAEMLQVWKRNSDFRPDTAVTTKMVVFPLDRETLHPAWHVVVPEHGVGNTFEIIVDATDGAILRSHNNLRYLVGGNESASYRVFTSDSPAPGSPGNATNNQSQFPFTTRSLVTLGATAESPNGWIDDGVNETIGNNVDAHLDLNADNSPDLPRPQGSPYRVFDYPYDPALEPSTYRDAAVTQMFYYTNLIHDKLYSLGFDEPAFNFQTSNFGLGGLEGDAVSADCQDGSGTNNANWNGSGSDGTGTRIQMYIFDDPIPDRDGDFDGDVVYHEYVHGLSIRLSGGTVFGEQSGGMGEGWGDFFGICLSAEPGDDPDGNYAMGGYVTFGLFGDTDNYYWGIRRYPYSTNMATSPLTYADTDPAQIVVPGGIPANAAFINNPADGVHNAGEIWCNSLIAARAELWNGGLGFAANDLIMQLVVDGLKLMPSNPNMLEARDAILAADLANNGGANLGELWAGFAHRGMGSSASSGSGSTTTGVVEAFDVPSLILFDFPNGTPTQLSPTGVTSFPMTVSGVGGDAPLSNTGTLFVSVNGGAFTSSPITSAGLNSYTVEVPAASCFDEVSYYMTVDSTVGVVSFPDNAPTDVLSGDVFTGVDTVVSYDFEVASGWTVGDPSDTATTGIWERGDPNGTAAQSEDDHTELGTDCWFTGQGSPGGGLGENDVDGGTTTLTSPVIDLSGGDATIGYWLWYNNAASAAPFTDIFRIELSNDGGSNWTQVDQVGPTGPDVEGGWFFRQTTVGDHLTPTANVQIRFIAADEGDGSIVEAMIDDFSVTRLLCDPGTVCATDLGFGGPGTMSLSVCGEPLATGNTADMEITGAPSGALVFILGGLFNSPTPFAGGQLVPIPILLQLVRVADGAGNVSLTIPGGGGPLTAYVQAAAEDPLVFGGFAISNAVQAEVLP